MIVRLFVREASDDRAMFVIPFGDGDPGAFAGGRTAPLGRDHQAPFELAIIRQHRRDAKLAALAFGDLGLGHPVDQRLFRRRLEQRQTQIAVWEHAAQRAFVLFRHKVDAARSVLIGHRDAADWCADWLQPVGNADIAEQVPAGGGDRGGAVIETFGGQVSRISAVDDMAR